MRKAISYFFIILNLSVWVGLLFSVNSLHAADRFWVNGTGPWLDSTNHWSATSGGAPGATLPRDTDNVFFDTSSFTSTLQLVFISAPAFCRDMDWTGSSDSIPQLVGAATLNIYGSLTFVAGMTINLFTGITNFRAITLGNTITTAGQMFLGDVYFDGAGGGWTLQDNFQTAGGIDIYLDNGTLNSNNQNITCQSFFSSNVNARELNLGSSTITLETNWDLSNTTNLVFDAGTSTILFNTLFANTTFDGGGLTYYDLTASGINNITIYGSDTFNILSVVPGIFDITLTLEVGQTQTVADLVVIGTPTESININSTSLGVTSTISKASGVICADWLNIWDNIATGGAAFYAGAPPNSIDFGNVGGWIFTDCPDTLTTTIAGTNITCNGLCDGTATVTPIDGVPPYTYLWSTVPPQTDSTATGLCPDTFYVMVTDAVPDTAYDTIIIIEPLLLTANISDSTNALCKDECNGDATASGLGGTPPYAYSWTNGDTGPFADTLCADTLYTVTVTDFNGCDTTTSVVLSEPDSLLSSITADTNVSCNGLCDGSATVTPVGGTPPYIYDWVDDPLAQTTPTADSLCAGTYNVLITDSNGCTSVSTALITEPASPLVIDSITGIDASCGGLCDGTSTVFLSGGTLPYTYLWNNGDTGPTADTLCGDTIGIIDTVTVTDANGCSATAIDTIYAPPTLTSSITDSVNISCTGVCDGTATIEAFGGLPPYTYSWNTTPVQTTPTATILCDTLYTGTVTDSNGCVTSSNVLINAPDTLTATIVNSTNANCFGTCSGTATVRAEGGIPPYTYSWSTIPIQTDTTATGLCAGFYTVTVTDANGCDTTDTITIIEPTVITSTTSVSCAGACDGTATVTPVGGTPPYNYQWHDSFFFPFFGETDSILDSLCTGTYCVITIDLNLCEDTTCITIDLPTITLSTTDPSCSGDCDGTATVTAAGGFPPYTYVWTDAVGSTISTDTIADTLCPGWYYIELTDSAGCVLTDSVEIFDPPVLTSGTMDSTDVLCFGDSNGTATVTPSGGTPPYAYLWNDPLAQTDSIADSLSVGTYTVTVTDANGCTAIDSIAISGPSLLTAAITSSSDPTCGGVCDGSATVTPGGGTGAYTYSWSPTAPVQTTPSATGLCAVIAGTTYTVVVTDANGCTATDSVTLFEPPPLVLTMTIDSNASCSGLCDGGATVAPAGGTGAYTYEWDTSGVLLPGETNPTITGLCAGVYYRVRVRDANNCITIDSVLISEPALLTAAILSSTNDSCGGACNGSATVTPGGGAPPYTYLWSPSGQTTALATGLCADTHYVTVTDTNGCTAADTVIITEPPVLTFGIAGTNVSCNGLCDGSAIVTPSGGVPPYTYQWDSAGVLLPGETDSIIDTLCPGIYNVSIIDTNGCTTTAGITITQPAALTSSILPASGTCGGICDVQAIVTPSDGTPGYTYQWYDSLLAPIFGETDSILDSLCGGKIYAIVTDANGCNVIDSVTVTMPDTLILVIDSTTNADCDGNCTGTATVSASGGTGLYAFLWCNGDTGPTADSLCAAICIATVTDANGCVDLLPVIITAPGGLSAIIVSFTNVSCYDSCDGDALVSVTGGTQPYTYQWYDALLGSISGETDSILDTVCAGKYYVIVIDNDSCIVTSDTVTITEPGIFTSFISDSTDVSCNGVCDGSATLTPSGGAPPFSYLWTPGGQTDSTATFLCAGPQIATVTDANGCIALSFITINEPDTLAIAFVTTPISCNGVCDASATASVAGGTSPYTYLWSPTGQTTPSATGLCPGTHTLTVTDTNGCVIIDSVTISTLIVLTAGITSTVSAGCIVCNGEATVAGSGGLPPYTYLWNTIPPQTDTTATGLCASIYTVTVTDANGCDTTISVTILGAGGLTTSITIDNISCIGVCDGEATVTPSGGVPPYIHQWDSAGFSLPGETDSILDSLCAGTTYTDTVTDANGCITIAPVTLIPPAVFLSSITDSSDITCNGDSNGTITVTLIGGTPPYTYEWLNNIFVTIGQTDSTATGLGPGCYNVTIDDANGCNTTQTNICITEPLPFSATITDSTNVSCNGLCDGSATVTPLGGILPLTYLWSPSGDTTTIADSLCAGMHIVTVTDSSGCIRTDSVLITQPAVFAIDTIIPVNVSCKDTCDGQATVTISGGSGGFSYLWSNGDITATADSLCDGIYNVTVTDTNGCGIDSSGVIITEPVALTSSVSSTDATCGGICDGTATVTAFGGTGAYTYSWSPSGGTDTTETGICEGIDTVIVTDANNCIALSTITIFAPPILTVDTFPGSVTPSQCLPICDGTATVFAGGGSAPYDFLWFPSGDTVNNPDSLCISTHTVTVTDDSGCVATLDVIIFGPNGFFSTIDTVINATCYGDCDGGAVVFAGGGFPPYTYRWDTLGGGTIPGPPDSNITNLCAGDYEAVVTDNTGCISTAPVTISEPAVFLASITDSTGVSCFGDSNGTATVFATGGMPPYAYAWSNGDTDSIADSLYAGIHSVIVTDTNGCGVDTLYVTIIGPLALTAVITDSTGVSCFNDSNGTAMVFAAGGTAPYTYLWSNSDITTTADSLYPGIHSVIVTDSNGCTTTKSVTIAEPAPLTSGITGSTDVGCDTICNGTATVSVSGGTLPYNYLWDNPAAQTDSFADSLCLGINGVTITDTNGCTITDSVDILGPTALVVSFDSVTDASCSTVKNGEVYLTVTGGTPPYTYLWSPGGNTTQDLINVFAGTYIVNITDSIGCLITDTAIVSALDTVIADAGVDISVCAGETATLIATAIGSNLLWSPGSTLNDSTILNPLATPDTTTVYILTVNTDTCTDRDTVVVNIVVVDAGEDVTIVNGGADTLTASGGTNYLWTPSAGLSDTTIPNPVASPFETTIYYVTDENGCVDSVTVIVQEGFPDGITPNGDGFNDEWELDFLRDHPDVSVQVYNRWGERVFNSRKGEKYANKFDGTFEGKELPVGTYYYIIDFNDDSEPLTGPITIMR